MFSIRNLFLKNLSDELLLEKFRFTNDSDYFGELFKRHAYVVLGTCKKYLLDREKAKDEAMNIFEELLEKGIDPKVYNFSAWIHVVTRNHCLMRIRKEKNKRTSTFEDEFTESSSFVEIEFADEKVPDYAQHLNACFEKLNEEQQKCVDLFYLKENPYKEITAMTGYSLDQVKSYIQNGKRNLKLCLERREGNEQI